METFRWQQRAVYWLVGLLMSILAGTITLNLKLSHEREDFEAQTHLIKETLNRRLSTLEAVLTSLAGFHQASDFVSDVNFSTFANELLNAYPYIQSALSLVRLEHEHRTEFVESKHEQGYYQFMVSEMTDEKRIIKAGERSRYLIINTMEPMPPHLGTLLGYDIKSDNDLSEAFNIALSSGQSIAAPVSHLLDSNASILIFKPVYQGRYAPDNNIDRVKLYSGAIAIEVTAQQLLSGIVPDNLQMDITFSQNLSSAAVRYEYLSRNEAALQQSSTGFEISNFLPVVTESTLIDFYGQRTRLDFEHRLVIKNDDLLWVLSAATLTLIIYISLVSVLRQHKIQRLHEQELSDYAARAAFTEENTDPILRIGHNGEILYSNEPGKKILDSWRVTVSENAPNAIQEFISDVLRGDSFKEMEVSSDNRHYTLRFIANHGHRHVNIYGRDDTEQIKFENDLLEAKQQAESANVAKSRFIATISHEVRTPINGVLGMLELLLNTRLDERQHKLADTASRSGKILLSLINDILDFSKLESNKFQLNSAPFQLEEIIDDAIQIVSEPARIKRLMINTHLPESKLFLIGDDIRIRQILINLLGNAVKFTEIGEIDLSVAAQSESREDITLRIEVSDTGIGISKSALPSIFDNFTQQDASTTRRYGGTGLGLAITKQLVDLMGGNIDVISTEGKGSVFTVTIPVKSQSQATGDVIKEPHTSYAIETSATSSAIREDISNNLQLKATVLLAEDNEINQEVASAMLESAGCIVTVVEDGILALEALKNNHFDLVLMDCQMPRMDGIETTRQVRKQQAEYSQIPIIALTADAQESAREKCEQAGMNDYLSKPFTQLEVQSIVEKWSPR